jgi:hypothetical protein
MSDVISISFTPSREYADATNRQRRILRERSYGATASDTFYLGLKDYDEVDPYARYRDDQRKPITVKAWRDKIEKARLFILNRQAQFRVREMAAALPPSVVKAFLRSLNYGES